MRESAVRFFFKHAGFSYNPLTETRLQGRWRVARTLAAAEKWAEEHELKCAWIFDECFDWSDEPDGADEGHCPWDNKELPCSRQHEAFGCVLSTAEDAERIEQDGKLKGREHLQSLWGIVDPDRHYRRVVEAELCLEQMHAEQHQEIEDAKLDLAMAI